MNATVFPSGEILGWVSPSDPSGGDVSLRFSPVSRATRKIAGASWDDVRHDATSHSPSGDQSEKPLKPTSRNCRNAGRSVILRSAPPNEGIKYSPLSSSVERIKAM